MNTWYVVVTSCFDNGRVTANLVDTVRSENKPESGFKSTRRCDVYTDYFATPEEANEFVEASRMS